MEIKATAASPSGSAGYREGETVAEARREGIQKALRLEYLTVGWNIVEAMVALVAGWMAGSIALVGFGLDSLIEVTSAGALIWRLRRSGGPDREVVAERRALRIVGWTFFLLAAYIVLEAVSVLARRKAPEESLAGILLAAVSLVVMPWLGLAKRRIAREVGSQALEADSVETLVCSYLSLTLLVGLGANALFGWWWADPVAALAITGFILREGKEALDKSRPGREDD